MVWLAPSFQQQPQQETAGWVKIESGRWTFITKEIYGQFPNWKQVVPETDRNWTSINLSDVAIKQLLLVTPNLPGSDGLDHVVRLRVTANYLNVEGRNKGDEDWTSIPMEAAVKGRPVTVALNRHYLLNALRFGLNQVEIEDPLSPVVFSNGGKKLIIMPVNLDGPKAAVPTPANSEATPATSPTAEQTAPPAQPEAQTERKDMPRTARATTPEPMTTFQPVEPANNNGNGNGNERFEQLNLAWLLASLFHDSGYALEHSKAVVACLSRIARADLSHMEAEMHKGFNVAAEIEPLLKYCARLGPAGEKVGKALGWVASKWNQEVPTLDKKQRLLDHGVLSAARLLHLTKGSNKSKKVKAIIMQAASAMALHNGVQLKELFPADELSQLDEVPFSIFPVPALLALCDTFQIWDREINEVTMPNDLKDTAATIAWVKRAFITGSQVVRFDWKQSPTEKGKWLGDVRIKYSMQHGEHSEDVCNSLKSSITRWNTSGRAKAMSKLFSLGEVAGVHVSYWIPGSNDPIEIDF